MRACCCALPSLGASTVVKPRLPTLLSPSSVKALKVTPYTIEEAERAAGMGSYIAPTETAVPDVAVGDNRAGDVADEDILQAAEVEVARQALAEAEEVARAAKAEAEAMALDED